MSLPTCSTPDPRGGLRPPFPPTKEPTMLTNTTYRRDFELWDYLNFWGQAQTVPV